MPGYSELIKNFEKIRDFVRDFFVFGYRGRGDYGEVSARSYDNERRRIRSCLEDYVTETWDGRGKAVSIARAYPGLRRGAGRGNSGVGI